MSTQVDPNSQLTGRVWVGMASYSVICPVGCGLGQVGGSYNNNGFNLNPTHLLFRLTEVPT